MTVESNSHAKNWLNVKVKPEVLRPTTNAMPIVLTPQSIPAFTIPRSSESPKQPQKNKQASCKSLESSGSRIPSPKPQYTSTSAPVSPRHEQSEISNSYSADFRDHTNADPFSKAAMGLTHFKTKTSFGFDTLVEKPHTRRKESLFHAEGRMTPSPVFASSKYHADSSSLTLKVPLQGSYSSGSSGSFPSPQQDFLDLFFPDPVGHSEDLCSDHSTRYYRRRSSLPEPYDGGCPLCSEEGADNSDPTDTKAPLTASLSIGNISPTRKVQREIYSENPGGLRRTLSDYCKLKKCSKTTYANKKPCTPPSLSEIKISFQYIPKSKTLKVVLIRAENLGDDESKVNSMVTLTLKPSKQPKLQSSVVKESRNPEYNQEFGFNCESLAQLKKATLKLKVFNKAKTAKELVGQVSLHLKSYDLLKENRVWRNLVDVEKPENLGCLSVRWCFEPNHERLRVRILSGSDFPRNGLGIAPDTYVQVVVTQPGRKSAKKQTKAIRKTANPDYDELLEFHVSPRMEDLLYTSITLYVYDRERLRSDDLIGRIHVGHESRDVAEADHWRKLMQRPGIELDSQHLINGGFTDCGSQLWKRKTWR